MSTADVPVQKQREEQGSKVLSSLITTQKQTNSPVLLVKRSHLSHWQDLL
jgi:hypothetical protein